MTADSTDATSHKGAKLRESVLDHCLLAMIAKRPRYGFEMVQQLDEAELLDVGEVSIYPRLSRMRNEGLIDSFAETSEETGRRRKYYRLLPDGQRTLGEYNRQWTVFREKVEAILELQE